MASTRFRALAATAVAALALCTACSSDGSGSDASADGPLKLAVFASLNGVPAFAADEEGVFEKHDLDVTISTAKTSTEMVPQLLGGKVDLALLDTATSLVAAGQGVDLVYVAGATDGGIPKGQEEFSFANVWVQQGFPDQVADLTGKTVGVPQIKSAPWVDLRGSVDEAGGDKLSIKFIESPAPPAALKSGQVDATTTPEPVGTVERAKGDLRPLGPGRTPAAVDRVRLGHHPGLRRRQQAKGLGEAVREGNAAVNGDRELLVRTAADPSMQVRGLGHSYGERQVLKDLDFEVGRGELMCVVGPSGVGKTTLLECLTGLRRPSEGQVLFDGKRIEAPPRGLAIVFQDYSRSLMPWLSVLDNVVLPLRSAGMAKAEREATAREALAEVGLSDFTGSDPGSSPAGCSSGSRSRGRWPTGRPWW
ncbi:hypothetical protein SHIRM173S_00813 [Streptomyces hirsutus]